MYRTNFYKNANAKLIKEMNDFCKDYIEFLSYGKTERLCVEKAVEMLEKDGYVNIDTLKKVSYGDKVYAINHNKNVAAFIIGKKPLCKGIRILGAHIDSPRLDVKQNPLYEDSGFALLDTHYYGGIKKYQWVTIPLALHGVICKKDGSIVNVNIGEDPKDPVFGISDLLIHLAADQLQKPAAKVIEGENLDVTLGSQPLEDKGVKANILAILKDKYDIEEEDFISSEIEITPAGPAREYGLDRSMIAGYGHDDRVCGYTSLRALLDSKKGDFTYCTILVDKEEIGSVGATGASSKFFENILKKLLILSGNSDFNAIDVLLENSYMLSSDVSIGYDPLFKGVCEPNNSSFLNNGVVFNKYTGSRGKSGSNDANPEYIAKIRAIMDDNKICYQTSELGRVDQGGGGTIAYILANYNMNVLDAGIPVLNMHAPMEIVAKADVFEAYRAYKAFLKK